MLLYICKYRNSFSGGIIVVAAKNAFNAMGIIHKYGGSFYLDENLEQIVGATYTGEERVIAQQTYVD